jgi:hypothetical protein
MIYLEDIASNKQNIKIKARFDVLLTECPSKKGGGHNIG